jgi:hypothetical protein
MLVSRNKRQIYPKAKKASSFRPMCTASLKAQARCQWLMPVILAIQEAEIKRIMVQSQPRQIIHETLSQKTSHKYRAGGVAQGEGHEFKPQYHQKKKKKKKNPIPNIYSLFILSYS